MANITDKPSASLSADGNLALLQIDDGRVNSLGRKALEEIYACITKASNADAVILTGRSRLFSVGLDLAEIDALNQGELIDFFDLLHDVRRSLFCLPRPLVTAAAGSAIGAGASLICCGDIRVGARDSGKVGFTEAQLGLPLPASARVIATNALTTQAGYTSLILGTTYGKEEAHTLGLFNTLCEPKALLTQAKSYAEDAAKTSTSTTMIKLSLRQAALDEMDKNKASSHKAMAEAWVSADAQTRIQQAIASMNKRKSR